MGGISMHESFGFFRAFSIIFVVFLVSVVVAFSQTVSYSVQDIAPGTVGNASVVYFPKKIGENGNITGYKWYRDSQAFIAQIWINGQEIPAGGTDSVGYDITSGSLVVGRGLFSSFDSRAYTFSPSTQNLYWLPCPLFSQYGRFCEAYANNGNGIIVGSSDPRYLYPQSGKAISRALVWDSGAMTEIFSEGVVSIANDINDAGTIVGILYYVFSHSISFSKPPSMPAYEILYGYLLIAKGLFSWFFIFSAIFLIPTLLIGLVNKLISKAVISCTFWILVIKLVSPKSQQ
jgi:hypothetical protein